MIGRSIIFLTFTDEMLARYLVLIFRYLRVMLISWFRFIPFQWFAPRYQEERREKRKQVTGKHLLIAVKGRSIESHHKELIKDVILEFVDLNVKSIILASSDVAGCIKMWDELNSRLGILGDAQVETGSVPNDPYGPNVGFNIFSRKVGERLKLFFQPIDLLSGNQSKFADNILKHNKKIRISYIVVFGDDDSSSDMFLESIKGILSMSFVLLNVIENLNVFLSILNNDLKSKSEETDQLELSDVLELFKCANKVVKVNLFLGEPIKLQLSAIPRLPIDLCQVEQFQEFFIKWIKLIKGLVTEVDTSTAACVIVTSILEQKISNEESRTINSFYGYQFGYLESISGFSSSAYRDSVSFD